MFCAALFVSSDRNVYELAQDSFSSLFASLETTLWEDICLT